MKFNQILRLTREKRGYSASDLAKLMGVKPYTIVDWELARGEPSIENIKKLSKILNVSTDVLLGNNLDSSKEYLDTMDLIENYKKSLRIDDISNIFDDLTSERKDKLLKIIKALKDGNCF